MTNQEILEAIQNIQESLNENDLDVNVVEAIAKLRNKINQYRKPIFKKEGEPVMDYWDDFIYTGLGNCDYVLCDFYVDGLQIAEI